MKHLDRIADWPARAHAAHYRVDRLAKQMRVTRRTLERFIESRFGGCPKAWLQDLRMRRASELVADASTVKEVAAELGYRHPHNFSRAFKRHFGHKPTHTPPPMNHHKENECVLSWPDTDLSRLDRDCRILIGNVAF